MPPGKNFVSNLPPYRRRPVSERKPPSWGMGVCESCGVHSKIVGVPSISIQYMDVDRGAHRVEIGTLCKNCAFRIGRLLCRSEALNGLTRYSDRVRKFVVWGARPWQRKGGTGGS